MDRLKKNTILLFLILTIFLNFSYAQKKDFNIGVKLLPGVSSIYAFKIFDLDDSKLSLNGGLEIKKNIKENQFYLQLGCFFMNRGSKTKIKEYEVKNGGSVLVCEHICSETLYYLKVPISFIIRFKKFFVGCGPNFNYFISRKFIVDGKIISREAPDYLVDKFLWGLHLHTGIVKKITPKLNFNCELFINPTFKSEFINYGLGIGFDFNLN